MWAETRLERGKMNNNKTVEQHRKEVRENQKERIELELNPLTIYSTTQLKKELRRRKSESR